MHICEIQAIRIVLFKEHFECFFPASLILLFSAYVVNVFLYTISWIGYYFGTLDGYSTDNREVD